MKRLFIAVLAMTMVLAGCSDNRPVASPVINKETEAATVSTDLPVAEETSDSNKEPTIMKFEILGELSTQAKIIRSGTETDGVLTFSNYGFVFVAQNGDEIRLPLNVVLLVIVDYETDTRGEILELLTKSYDYKFLVEVGYTDKLSEYVLVSQALSKY